MRDADKEQLLEAPLEARAPEEAAGNEPLERPFLLVRFETEADCARFDNLLAGVAALLTAFVGASAVTFCTSGFTRAPSNVDAIAASVDLLTVDVASAAMVLVGFAGSHACVQSQTTAAEYWQLVAYFGADLLVATVLASFVGSLYMLSVHAFNFGDLLLTLVEGATSLRVLDQSQAAGAPHSLNVFAWLVMCMALPAALLPATLAAIKQLHQVAGIGIYAVVVACLGGVLLFSLFASLREQSNVFYSNASGVGYRMIEFNVGVNMYYLMHQGEPLMLQLVAVALRVRAVVVAVFVCAWWAELGAARRSDGVCVRLYHFNACLQDHHGVLLRGCLLGACCAAWLFEPAAATGLACPLQAAMNAASTVLLCTPVFCAVKCVLDVSFGAEIVNANTALLSLALPVVATAVVFGYNLKMKPVLQGELAALGASACARVRRQFAQPDSRPAPPASETRVEAAQTFYPSLDS